jgi:hypothetical protein
MMAYEGLRSWLATIPAPIVMSIVTRAVRIEDVQPTWAGAIVSENRR